MKPAVVIVVALSGCAFDRSGTLGDSSDADADAGADPAADAAAVPDADADPVPALLALVAGCDDKLGGGYAPDHGGPEDIDVCGLDGAVYWKADLDIDCDGVVSDVCNWDTDPWFQDHTSATTSTGEWLDAASLPFVVLPQPSHRWSFHAAGLDHGNVIAVIYDGKLQFGVFGDQGPREIIGEASYRMAELLGIDPHPIDGGADSGAVYIAFPGDSGRVEIIEDHAEAVAVGQARVAELLAR